MRQTIKSLVCAAAALCMFSLASTSHALGYYKFCGRWGYTFNDQNLGEDYLKYTGTNGVQAAKYTWANVFRDGAEIWHGYMDSTGCTGALTGSAGTYEFRITSAVKTPNGAYLYITPTENQQFRYFRAVQALPAVASNTQIRYHTLGTGDTTASVAAVAVQMAQANDNRFPAGTALWIYSESLENISQYVLGGAVYYARNVYAGNNWAAYSKTIVAHEIGHAVQYHLFGSLNSDYSDAAQQELCTCVHIDSGYPMNLHCLQSREKITSAQNEGWGQFIAADLFNSPSDSSATFAYYKEVRAQAGGPDMYPPVGVVAYDVNGTYRWMESKGCAEANKGTELDWLNFYYEINNKGTSAYSLNDLRNVYRKACGNTNCTGSNTVTWSALQSAVNTLYGATSAKATYWSQIGDRHGVNH